MTLLSTESEPRARHIDREPHAVRIVKAPVRGKAGWRRLCVAIYMDDVFVFTMGPMFRKDRPAFRPPYPGLTKLAGEVLHEAYAITVTSDWVEYPNGPMGRVLFSAPATCHMAGGDE